jgi:hypothetical protein
MTYLAPAGYPLVRCTLVALMTVKRHSTRREFPRRYPYFDVVMELAWSYDPERSAGGSVAAGRVSHAGYVKSDDPDKNGYPGPPRWGVWRGVDGLTP